MRYILPVIVILLAASVAAQVDEKCYGDCYNNCVGKADAEYCSGICREECTPEKITTPKETPSCEDLCRERISSNNPDELEQCIQDCQPPETCEESCEREFRGVPVKIQECYIRECGHPRPALMSCEDICRRDYGKDERQFQGCMAKRCLVTAYITPAEVAPREQEIIAIMPRAEILQPTTPGCQDECRRSFERCTSGCGRPECPRPEPACETGCTQTFRQCITEISPQDDMIAAVGQCKQHALECFAECLPRPPRGEIALPRTSETTEPIPEPSQAPGFFARIWSSIAGD